LQVCGLEGGIAVSCGGTNGISGAAAVSWPLVRYLQLQWQVSASPLSWPFVFFVRVWICFVAVNFLMVKDFFIILL